MLLAVLAATAVLQPKTIAFTGATVIDGTRNVPAPNTTIVITGDRITQVGADAIVKVPDDAQRIDASGKWIMPGLIDMHVHMDEAPNATEFTQYGVTSVRDMGSRLVTLQQLRAKATRGAAIPRVYWMGRNIDQTTPSWWGAVAVKDASGVAALLNDMAHQGVDGVKLYVNAGPTVTKAVIEQAHKRGWPVTAHLGKTTPSQASAFGIDNLEHVSTLFDELRAKPSKASGYLASFIGVPQVDLYSSKAQRLVSTLATNKTAVTPTLVAACMPVDGVAGAQRTYTGWANLSPAWRKNWALPYWSFISVKGWSGPDFATAHNAFEQYERLVKRLHNAGVPIIAGTDTPAPMVLPGAGLVYELELLTRCGLSPQEAICAATGDAARVLRREQQVGTILPGRFADLLILNADPVDDIRNLRHVSAVYLGGRKVN